MSEHSLDDGWVPVIGPVREEPERSPASGSPPGAGLVPSWDLPDEAAELSRAFSCFLTNALIRRSSEASNREGGRLGLDMEGGRRAGTGRHGGIPTEQLELAGESTFQRGSEHHDSSRYLWAGALNCS